MLSDGGPAFDREFVYDPITGNLIFKDGVTLGYPASVSCPGGGRAIPHAVSSTGTNSYTYDCNGNMVGRTISGSANTLTYDYENRLTGVSGAANASFIYDGDGNRVKTTLNGQTTVYIGGYFEWTGSTSTMKKYYSAGPNRIAVRTGDGTGDAGLLYLLGDHLGSTTVAANPDGTLNSKQLYMPFGDSRFTSGSLPTEYKFTGQMEVPELGLYYYNARYYDPYLGRFIAPDSIVPNLTMPIDWDRYNYVHNNPIKNVDPTGYTTECGLGGGNYCSILTNKYAHAVDWKRAGLTQDEFIKAYESYDYYSTNPEAALNDCINDTNSYAIADAYSEYVLHQLFLPFDEGPVLLALEQAKQEENAPQFYKILMWLVAPMFYQNDKGYGSGSIHLSPNQMNSVIKKGQAPKGVLRVDQAKVPGEQLHVHFDDGSALNADGTWKHGQGNLTNDIKDWLRQNGWNIS